MTVSELIAILEDCDPDATVLLQTQVSWPFESTLQGVAVREDFMDCEEEEEGPSDSALAANDVFLVEGRQLRYGSKAAWDVAKRY